MSPTTALINPLGFPVTHYCGGVTLILKVVVLRALPSPSVTLVLLSLPYLSGSLNIPLFRVLTSSRGKNVMRRRKGSRTTPHDFSGILAYKTAFGCWGIDVSRGHLRYESEGNFRPQKYFKITKRKLSNPPKRLSP